MKRAVPLLVLAALGCTRTHAATPGVHRVVSISPSTSETMFAIGAGDLLVGRSRYCDYPAEVRKLPQIGGYVDPNLEAILALKPDLVTGARGPAGPGLVDKLGTRGIATFFPETESFAQIDEMIRGLGVQTAHVPQASALLDAVHARIAGVERAIADTPKLRVLLVFGLEPIVAAGPKTFADEMLRHAGATNVIAEGIGYPTLGIERVLALDPDMVLNAAIAESHGAERITKDAPGWRELRAVKTGHVAALTDEAVLRPGPRVGEGLAQIARAVHPEAAASIP